MRIPVAVAFGLLLSGVALADTDSSDEAAISGLKKCVSNNAASLAALTGWEVRPGGTPPGVPLTGSSDPCGTVPWSGLICSGNRIQQIIMTQLGDKGISGCDVGTLGGLSKLSALDQLDLSGSGLVGTLPDAWSSGFPALTRLTVAMNAIKGTLPPSWASGSAFPLLNELDVSQNQITGTLPTAYGNKPAFPALQNFVVSQNKMTGKLPPWTGFQKVALLGLNENSFSGDLPTTWSFPVLQRLQLESNNFAGCLPSTWSTQLPQLTHLDVSKNKLSGSIPASYDELDQLIDITIKPGNSFCGTISSSLATTPNGMSARFQPEPASRNSQNGYDLGTCSGDACPAYMSYPVGAPTGGPALAPTLAPTAAVGSTGAVSSAGRKLLQV